MRKLRSKKDASEQRENSESVAVQRERDEMPVAEHQRPIRNRKQTVRYGLEEQINVAEEVAEESSLACQPPCLLPPEPGTVSHLASSSAVGLRLPGWRLSTGRWG